MNLVYVFFDWFVQVIICKGIFKVFQEFCDYLELKLKDYCFFYYKFKLKFNYWKVKVFWVKLDKWGSYKDYKKGKVCINIKCFIIGVGFCGFCIVIDLFLLGVKVVVIEK